MIYASAIMCIAAICLVSNCAHVWYLHYTMFNPAAERCRAAQARFDQAVADYDEWLMDKCIVDAEAALADMNEALKLYKQAIIGNPLWFLMGD